MFNLIIFFLSFIALFLIIDFLQKKVITRFRWSRKATHVLAGGIIVLMPYYLSSGRIIALAGGFLVILAISKWKRILSLHDVDRDTIGEVLYPMSIGIIAGLCLPEHITVFQLSALVLAVSDGFTGILGEAWDFKSVKLGKHTKSLGGSIVFFITTFLLLVLFHGISLSLLLPLLLFALGLTILEFFLVYGFDNLGLPVLAALLELWFFV